VTAVVVARDLAVGYDGRPVVDALDLEVGPGRVLALVGTNGSGKSTLLKTFAGLLPAISGHLEVFGAPPGASPHRLAYLSQFHRTALVLPLRSRDVVRMGRFADHGLLGRLGPVDERLVDESMARMGVADLARRPLRDLSGGQQQRVYLAQALARRGDLLVLDEPTAGIDAAGAERYTAVVEEERARGATVVVATHDIADAARADDVLLLAGRVVAHGPPAEVLTAEHLLDAFGIALRRVEDALLLGEEPHGHERAHGPERDEPPGRHIG
jgi:ABC-type Mn2+/Zn2+ transport system ATPase subunit